MYTRATTPMALRDFRASLHGEVIMPDGDGYDSARRVWNGMIDNYQAMIIRCASRADVVHAVGFARLQHLPVAVRGGGHSICGKSVCDGGIVIDLSQMKGIRVDPLTCTARAEAGLTLGEFVRAIQPFGLLATTGTPAGTGLAGLTLGGGLGWFMAKYGLTIDNLLAADLVTADGRVLRASATEHADLFWGLRSGGGNFSIVTAFDFQLHAVGAVLAGKVVYPMSRAREVLSFYREYTSSVPDGLTAYASLLTTPTASQRLPSTSASVAPLPRANASSSRSGSLETASTLKHLSDEAIETLVDSGAARTSPSSLILIQHVHGEALRVSPTATAFALREESYVISLLAAWDGGEAQRHIAWARACWRALSPFASSGVYVNFLGDEREERVRAAYGVNYERLVALKNRYDPTNFFALNQNIRPTVKEPYSRTWLS
jgi:FAD/FMN-containing dehydrogenase